MVILHALRRVPSLERKDAVVQPQAPHAHKRNVLVVRRGHPHPSSSRLVHQIPRRRAQSKPVVHRIRQVLKGNPARGPRLQKGDLAPRARKVLEGDNVGPRQAPQEEHLPLLPVIAALKNRVVLVPRLAQRGGPVLRVP